LHFNLAITVLVHDHRVLDTAKIIFRNKKNSLKNNFKNILKKFQKEYVD